MGQERSRRGGLDVSKVEPRHVHLSTCAAVYRVAESLLGSTGTADRLVEADWMGRGLMMHAMRGRFEIQGRDREAVVFVFMVSAGAQLISTGYT